MGEKLTEEFMLGLPNRAEVANYVNALLEEKYMNLLCEVSDGAMIGLMVIQAVLIKNGITTEDELKTLTLEFSKIHSEKSSKKDETK